jgi:hypothetical protein
VSRIANVVSRVGPRNGLDASTSTFVVSTPKSIRSFGFCSNIYGRTGYHFVLVADLPTRQTKSSQRDLTRRSSDASSHFDVRLGISRRSATTGCLALDIRRFGCTNTKEQGVGILLIVSLCHLCVCSNGRVGYYLVRAIVSIEFLASRYEVDILSISSKEVVDLVHAVDASLQRKIGYVTPSPPLSSSCRLHPGRCTRQELRTRKIWFSQSPPTSSDGKVLW